MSRRDDGGRGRMLVAVLVLQVLVAVVFIVLVATESLPLPGGAIAPVWAVGPAAS